VEAEAEEVAEGDVWAEDHSSAEAAEEEHVDDAG
jgi:hypothetical protein